MRRYFPSLSQSATFSLLAYENAAALTQPKYAAMYVGSQRYLDCTENIN